MRFLLATLERSWRESSEGGRCLNASIGSCAHPLLLHGLIICWETILLVLEYYHRVCLWVRGTINPIKRLLGAAARLLKVHQVLKTVTLCIVIHNNAHRIGSSIWLFRKNLEERWWRSSSSLPKTRPTTLVIVKITSYSKFRELLQALQLFPLL
jgi:hypothetical protein